MMAAERGINFIVGQKFGTVEEVKKQIKDYNKANFSCFVIGTNNKHQLQAKCKHGAERASKSTGKRTNLHVNYVGCLAKVIFFKSAKDGSYKLTSFLLITIMMYLKTITIVRILS